MLEASNIQLLLFFISGITLAYLYVLRKRKRNLPPGPSWNPFGKIFGKTATEAKEYVLGLAKYGDMCCINVLGKPCIYLNTHERIRDVMVAHGEVTSARLNFTVLKHRLTIGRGLIMNDGQSWQDHRRFALSTLRDFGFGKGGTEQIIQSELQALASDIESNGGKAFDPRVLLNAATCNVICALVFGERCGNEAGFAVLLNLLQKTIETEARMHEYYMLTLFKLFMRIPLFLRNTSMEHLDQISDYLEGKLMEHRRKSDGSVKDVIDAYLKEMREAELNGGQHTSFNDKELFRTIMDLFVAGMETTATTLRWGLLFMIQHPDIQKRVQTELDEHLQGRLPSASDRRDLVYTDAVIMEIQRFATLTPLGAVPHRCTDDVRVGKYVIPKDSLLYANLYAAHRDESKWPDAHNFNPANFYDENTKTIRNAEYLIPFGVGRRSCLGESLAKQELLILFAGMLQQFEFVPGDLRVPREDECLFGRIRLAPSFRVCALKRA